MALSLGYTAVAGMSCTVSTAPATVVVVVAPIVVAAGIVPGRRCCTSMIGSQATSLCSYVVLAVGAPAIVVGVVVA